ncbi:hypothetical protein [Streptomyces incarnatus]|uniref:hypothetical protein n=1 Tax=Streptomyces incarnatus TaxID=665007 RepID=UPI001AD7F08E|nr:hypothetical protein [Streptomyces incarnatus]
MPTDPRAEAGRSRIARRLDPDDLRWLARHCCCPDDAGQETAGQETKDRCSRIRFRAGAVLHESGPAD